MRTRGNALWGVVAWISGIVFRGDFGVSIRFRAPALDLVLDRMPATLKLAVAALAIAVLLGIPLGTLAALHHRKFTDYAIPPGYSPTAVIENTAAYRRSPLPGPFDLPSRNNPWPWNWCTTSRCCTTT